MPDAERPGSDGAKVSDDGLLMEQGTLNDGLGLLVLLDDLAGKALLQIFPFLPRIGEEDVSIKRDPGHRRSHWKAPRLAATVRGLICRASRRQAPSKREYSVIAYSSEDGARLADSSLSASSRSASGNLAASSSRVISGASRQSVSSSGLEAPTTQDPSRSLDTAVSPATTAGAPSSLKYLSLRRLALLARPEHSAHSPVSEASVGAVVLRCHRPEIFASFPHRHYPRSKGYRGAG